MDTILLVIAINFLVVPFLQEAEALGRNLQRFPTFPHILRLAHVRKSHWLRPFCIGALLLLAFAVLRAQSGQVEGLTVVAHFTLMQLVLWTVVALSVRKQARSPSQARTSVDELPGRSSPALLPRRS
jgi:hypothetical protein